MSASLLEMVLAIVLSGLIFASALIPTTQSLAAYEEAQLGLQNMTAQTLALTRAEQLVGAIWRDPNAPPDGANLQAAVADRLQVGTWELRQSGGRVEQQRQAAGWSPLATPVQSFSFQYLLRTGVWTAAPASGDLAKVLAVRYGWTDPTGGLPYGGLLVAPDHAFAAGLIALAAPDHSTTYHRADYARQITLTLGAWP
jgi:hypothetical protein